MQAGVEERDEVRREEGLEEPQVGGLQVGYKDFSGFFSPCQLSGFSSIPLNHPGGGRAQKIVFRAVPRFR